MKYPLPNSRGSLQYRSSLLGFGKFELQICQSSEKQNKKVLRDFPFSPWSTMFVYDDNLIDTPKKRFEITMRSPDVK